MFIATWTDELIARLEKLFHEGLSARLIANELGVSRNAVIGKFHRMGLKATTRVLKTVVSQGGPKRVNKPAARAKPAIAFPRAVHFISAVEPHHIALMDLRDHHCRYPYDGKDGEPTSYCGHVKHAGSYCAVHHLACTEVPYKQRRAA